MKLILAILLSLVRADVPVLCSKSDKDYVGSIWSFHVSEGGTNDHESKGTVNLFNQNVVCSHELPNRVQLLAEGQQISFKKQSVWNVKILDDRNVEAYECPIGKNCDKLTGQPVKGFWDILYQEELLVQLENNVRFIASFKYTPNKKARSSLMPDGHGTYIASVSSDNPQPAKELQSFDGNCEETMVGFVQKVNGAESFSSVTIQCFYGVLNEIQSSSESENQEVKKQNKNQQKNETEQGQSFSSISDDYANQKYLNDEPSYVSIGNYQKTNYKKQRKAAISKKLFTKQTSKKVKKSQKALYPWQASPENDNFLLWAKQNENLLGWSANLCLLSKDNKHYNKKDCQEKPLTLAQTSLPFGEGEKFAEALQIVQTPASKFSSASEILREELPKKYDLRNILGYDFTGDVRDQGGCGSCFAHSVVQVAESRLKIKTGQKVPNLSVQAILGCDFLAEGCSGGWSTNTAFFLENGQLMTEECAPYKGETLSNCASYAHCGAYARVKNTQKLYQPNDLKIMQEIYRNGPVSVSWNPPQFIASYRGGVLAQLPNLNDKQAPTYFLENSFVQFADADEQPAHASILVGWDEDPKQGPVWILRNSFGTNFGQKGDVLIPRGGNAYNTETHITVFEPELI